MRERSLPIHRSDTLLERRQPALEGWRHLSRRMSRAGKPSYTESVQLLQ